MKQSQNTKRFWTAGRLALTASVFCVALLVASSCTSNDTANLTANNAAQANSARQPKVTITSQQGPQPRQQASNPENIPQEVLDADIQSVGGGTFRLGELNKNKVVVLDLWATWCGPCRLEIPHLVDLSKEYAGKGVEVVGLTTEDPETTADKVRDFAKEFNINYKLGYAQRQTAEALMAGNYSIPQTFVIAPGGRIVTKFRGFSPQIPSMIRAAIDKANEKTNGD
jgi:thiol-disulfide isomerase/thioredoxin